MNNKEVIEYREELKERVMRIETITERMEGHLGKLNDRTSKLEGWRNWMVGGMAMLGFLLGIFKLGVL